MWCIEGYSHTRAKVSNVQGDILDETHRASCGSGLITSLVSTGDGIDVHQVPKITHPGAGFQVWFRLQLERTVKTNLNLLRNTKYAQTLLVRDIQLLQ
jgi:hypothetical protein